MATTTHVILPPEVMGGLEQMTRALNQLALKMDILSDIVVTLEGISGVLEALGESVERVLDQHGSSLDDISGALRGVHDVVRERQ